MADLPDGYYALPDPADDTTMTYWRVTSGKLGMWPARSWYGPARPLKRDAPADREDRIAWIKAWAEQHDAWSQTVRSALASAPEESRARFAAFTIRCCDCGRALTDAKSKTLGFGPDCRRGYDEAWLAVTYTPRIAEAHAEAARQPASRRPAA